MELLFKFIRNLGILIFGVILVLTIVVPLVWLIQNLTVPWNYISSGIIIMIVVAFVISLVQYLNEKDNK